MKHTKEEISLCKQIAEKYRKEIKRGDWAIEPLKANIPLLVIDTQMEYITLSLNYEVTHCTTCKSLIPLWTISDCLEWLEEKEFNILIEGNHDKEKRWWIGLAYGDAMPHLTFKGKTSLLACLKAILAVLEDKK